MTGPHGRAEPAALREPVAELSSIGIVAFTTTRAAGDFALGEPEPAVENVARWHALAATVAPGITALASARQVHGASAAEYREPWRGWRRLDGCDGHVIHVRGVAAAVTIADCVPVFVAHPGGTVAMVHAGWRGVVAQIVPSTIDLLRREGLDPADLRAHLGPAICGRCYEVGPGVYQQLTGWQTTRSRHVDLRALIAEALGASGVRAVSASPWCTKCDNDRFFSHRAGDSERQVAVVASFA